MGDDTEQAPKRGSRGHREYRPRLRGAEREKLRRQLAQEYNGGSIRELAARHNLSFGLTRLLLIEEDVELRSRGNRKAEQS
ncbi:helix-turn-helix domain-containing protein [Streptomyces kronopolitis]|uniref:helix-turn-helix domain-containing protein n=1 Tax=Streptomyces kronopolitis TaxID=1612435 RepID=UPI00344A87E2